ncbi:Eco57I restriction-modification methylase domain-containing protein [Croceibacter atlanticus]|uniref:Eco57I restriction-modification methylase domain-containing protein n=1 Tax=Croceibacter atlanticus TaxID=313588 RepID=UPI0024904453|nr:TaqI-like C-terminal specificity domain-containing protein [Croceibacter atlanticus]
MSLFQNSVLNKYLKGLESEKVNQAYERFTSHFHNPTIQENIRNSKEEQYQGEFLIDLFVNVFGYVKNPTPDFNLTTELKNIKGSKKTDGAILKGEKALAVIELKGTNTTDLSKVETQAFGYKNNQPGCNYVITSNFEKLRFYIDNAVDFEEFNLFQLSKGRFNILWLCLSSEYLLKDIPKKIKDESLTQEENVTKKLYKDYASFRNEIFDAIQNENPEYDKLTLFKKTQKLLDRFLFIFFAEDRLLLPPNSIRSIVNQWTDLRDKYDEYFPLYDRFKKYFGYMNTGHKGQQHDIFAYNGGLFAPDEILDNIKINDDLLHKHTINLSNYDFESEVSVNILGHIFEHSLNDIDEIQAEIQGIASEQSKTKRKKDGVFYTPKYITKYIVDNTVGKLCEEKKTELDIQEAEYEKERKGRKKATLKNLTQKLEDYRKWLLQITICDPACGSGAFLNQALEFLIAEHQYIDELQAKLFGDAMVLSEVENAILENNIFGVDINEESVDIAKLSLWLRTAQKGRKLTSLNSNIKSGNSLIDNPIIAEEKAFNWHEEFPNVFAKGGFDVVIGNPPYVLCQPSNTKEIVLDYYKDFKVASYKIDLFHLFFEKSIEYLKTNGKLGFITPNTYLNNKYIKPLRSYILEQTSINTLINYKDQIFVDAGVDVATIILTKEKNVENNITLIEVENSIENQLGQKPQDLWKKDKENTFNLNTELDIDLSNCALLGDLSSITFGLQTKDKKTYVSNENKGDNWESCYTGKDVNRYYLADSSLFFLNKPDEVKAGGSWNMDNHHSKKIVVRQVGNPEPIFAFDNFGYATLNTMYSIVINKENINYSYLLAILNSRLIKSYFLSKYSDGKQLFPKIKGFQLKELPIKITKENNQIQFIEKANKMLSLNKDLRKIADSFVGLLQGKFSLEKISKKTEKWYELEFSQFSQELKKKKVQLSLSEEAEWMQYFNEQKEIAQNLKYEINQTDAEINQMVYELYGLSENEIKIVENANA